MTPLYRVTMKRDDRWEVWTNYREYDGAVEAASGLVQSGHATECRIDEVTSLRPGVTQSGTLVANVTTAPAVGWPHGRAVVERLSKK